MGVLKLKSCSRCKKGDVTIDRDQYGWYEFCIQCGHMRDLTIVADFKQTSYRGVSVRERAAKHMVLSRSH